LPGAGGRGGGRHNTAALLEKVLSGLGGGPCPTVVAMDGGRRAVAGPIAAVVEVVIEVFIRLMLRGGFPFVEVHDRLAFVIVAGRVDRGGEPEGSGGGGGSGRDAHGPRSLAEQGGTRDVPWGCGEPGERSSCDRWMEEARNRGDGTNGDDLTHIDGRCRLAEGRTRGGSLPLRALIGSIDKLLGSLLARAIMLHGRKKGNVHDSKEIKRHNVEMAGKENIS
jgi:hypothetical protein